jgi:hypothetical protein
MALSSPMSCIGSVAQSCQHRDIARERGLEVICNLLLAALRACFPRRYRRRTASITPLASRNKQSRIASHLLGFVVACRGTRVWGCRHRRGEVFHNFHGEDRMRKFSGTHCELRLITSCQSHAIVTGKPEVRRGWWLEIRFGGRVSIGLNHPMVALRPDPGTPRWIVRDEMANMCFGSLEVRSR